MKKYFSLFAVAVILMFSSCGKDQALVNELVGDWDVTHVYSFGFDVAATLGLDDVTYHFDPCRVKSEWCDGFFSDPSAGSTTNFQYKVFNQGANFSTLDSAGVETIGDIVLHSSSTFAYSASYSGVSVEVHMQKIE